MIRSASSTATPKRVAQLARAFSTLVSHFPPATAAHLSDHGHATFDAAVSPTTSSALRAEIDHLVSEDHLRLNATHITGRGTNHTFYKTGIHEAELNLLSEDALSSIPNLCALRHDPTIRSLLSVLWPCATLHTHAIKVQRAEGGAACFPIHVDSAPDVDTRVVTALLYLNEGWDTDFHGGSLRLYENPVTSCDVDPLDGRLVLLASTALHHRVLPAFRQRYVITMWCSGTIRPTKRKHVTSTDSDMDFRYRLATTLLAPRFRDMAFRLALVEEWERSLWEAHSQDVATKAVELHRANLKRIRDRVPAAVCADIGQPGAERDIRDIVQRPERLRGFFREVAASDPDALAFQW